jgi:hypothetical protein
MHLEAPVKRPPPKRQFDRQVQKAFSHGVREKIRANVPLPCNLSPFPYRSQH